MQLEAVAQGLFTSRHDLLLDSRPAGWYSGRMLSSVLDVRLEDGRMLELQRRGFFSATYQLVDTRHPSVLAGAEHVGLFSQTWELRLSAGQARLVSAGWLNYGFRLYLRGREVAEVNQRGVFRSGWRVESGNDLPLDDLLMVGLVYHLIVQRRRAAADS